MAGAPEASLSVPEADLLPLSGLQHVVFCERQCALIHVERLWTDNALTAEGSLLHERVDSGEAETRGDVRIIRGVHIRSHRLGVVGRADVVELHQWTGDDDPERRAVPMPGAPSLWQPVPVEYKRGEPKFGNCDRVQVCAQAICLEEMLGVIIPRGILFYGKRRRRSEVELDAELRATTADAAQRFHDITSSGEIPFAVRQPKCANCSLLDLCLPPRRRQRSAAAYLDRELRAAGLTSPTRTVGCRQ